MRLPFEVLRTPTAMQTRAESLRRDGRRIALVPTMGALHAGHQALLLAARAQADVVILSIFVNPTQFAAGEDLSKYPRDEAADLAMAQAAGTDLVFCPDAASMYPSGSQTVVSVPALAVPMCGVSRPTHFAGVATIVTKLFNLTRPHLAVFGSKDYQQLAIIRRLSTDLDLGVEIVAVLTVREPDGLAMSSRNVFLSPDERQNALALSQGLHAAQQAFSAGERDASMLLKYARAPLETNSYVRIDYVELRDAADLTEVTDVTRPTVLAIAAFVGTTRLIDNCVLG